jgi:predicted nucleotidyltransferase
MNVKQSSEASHFLLALARRNAQVYAAHPNTRAILVTGSAAEGVSDFYSDLDMILYYEKLPTAEDLRYERILP